MQPHPLSNRALHVPQKFAQDKRRRKWGGAPDADFPLPLKTRILLRLSGAEKLDSGLASKK
jgi:hypothetical protein